MVIRPDKILTFCRSSWIILLTYYQEKDLDNEFFEFHYTKHLRYITTYPALNFNLSSLTSGLGQNNTSLEVSKPKMISPEEIIKEPPKGSFEESDKA